jgi:hypothetical protein
MLEDRCISLQGPQRNVQGYEERTLGDDESEMPSLVSNLLRNGAEARRCGTLGIDGNVFSYDRVTEAAK